MSISSGISIDIASRKNDEKSLYRYGKNKTVSSRTPPVERLTNPKELGDLLLLTTFPLKCYLVANNFLKKQGFNFDRSIRMKLISKSHYKHINCTRREKLEDLRHSAICPSAQGKCGKSDFGNQFDWERDSNFISKRKEFNDSLRSEECLAAADTSTFHHCVKLNPDFYGAKLGEVSRP
ncbi:CLUMA_CG001568, isoform A [Clunio marinus]|uniref:CLUMA_CG001568, isoform A n=1 Tax=Clunio marinus TaxID=568069 RepID=A0A1J1HI85_9DIPT|nr:CLUMA_CG001568, isoform A [Clunio marinus]